MSDLNSVVAVYDTHEQAELAIRELQEAGVDMKSLSIAGKDTHTDENVVGYYNTGALKTDKFLLIAHGSTDDVDKARDIIAGTKHSFYTVHGERVLTSQ